MAALPKNRTLQTGFFPVAGDGNAPEPDDRRIPDACGRGRPRFIC